MARFFLAPYTIRAFSRDDGEALTLSSFETGQDFLTVLSAYLQERADTASHDIESHRLLRVVRRDPSARFIPGLIETGEYGYESTIVNAESVAVSYQRLANDAEMLPFYFLFCIPTGVDEGILLLQRTGTLGIRKILLADFSDYFDQRFGDSRLEINPLIPQQLIDRYLGDGRVTKLRFVKFDIPSDITDAFDAGGQVERAGHAELVVTARRNGTLPLLGRLRGFLNGTRDMHQIVELRDLGFEYDTVKVELELQGNRRTVDLSNLHRLRATYDISEDVELAPTGHPSFDSIDRAARRLLGELAAGMGINPNV